MNMQRDEWHLLADACHFFACSTPSKVCVLSPCPAVCGRQLAGIWGLAPGCTHLEWKAMAASCVRPPAEGDMKSV